MTDLSRKCLKWPLLIGKVVILAAFTVILSPVALIMGIWLKIRGRSDTTPHELAKILRGACDEGHPYWDELECALLGDAQLEAIRQEALKVSEPLTPEGRSKLIGLAEQAEALSPRS